MSPVHFQKIRQKGPLCGADAKPDDTSGDWDEVGCVACQAEAAAQYEAARDAHFERMRDEREKR